MEEDEYKVAKAALMDMERTLLTGEDNDKVAKLALMEKKWTQLVL